MLCLYHRYNYSGKLCDSKTIERDVVNIAKDFDYHYFFDDALYYLKADGKYHDLKYHPNFNRKISLICYKVNYCIDEINDEINNRIERRFAVKFKAVDNTNEK